MRCINEERDGGITQEGLVGSRRVDELSDGMGGKRVCDTDDACNVELRLDGGNTQNIDGRITLDGLGLGVEKTMTVEVEGSLKTAVVDLWYVGRV